MSADSRGGLRRYLLSRLALAPLFLWIILTTLFVMLRVAPGDPITAALGARLSPEALEERRAAAGLNDSILEQYVNYLTGVLRGDFGQPFTDTRTVTEIIGDRFTATVELTLFAMVIAVVLGILVGAWSARRRDRLPDVAGRLFGVFVYAAPVFWTGILAQLVFSKWLGWLPSGNRMSARVPVSDIEITGLFVLDGILRFDLDFLVMALKYLVLPGTTLGLLIAGVFIRLVRVNMLQTLRADYVESAVGRGVGERQVVFRHAFRNALIPVITIMGLQFALLLGGAILTETTFSWPGLGSALVDFLRSRDYAAVQGIVTFYAIIIVVISLLIDVLNGLVDPRVRY